MKKTLDKSRLRSLYSPALQAFGEFVQHQLHQLNTEKEIPKVKKKLSLGLAVALILSVLPVAAALATILSPTADVFGWLYGNSRKEELLRGDIAPVAQTHVFQNIQITLEEVVYKTAGDMQGLYGTGLIAPKAGSNVVLVADDYSINDPAGYAVHCGRNIEIPENAPSYAELAAQNGAKLLLVRAIPDAVSINGFPVVVEIGVSFIPQADGTVRFAFEIPGDVIPRAETYDLTMYAGINEWDAQGGWGEHQADYWQVVAVPAISHTSQAEIEAQTPVPASTPVPAP